MKPGLRKVKMIYWHHKMHPDFLFSSENLWNVSPNIGPDLCHKPWPIIGHGMHVRQKNDDLELEITPLCNLREIVFLSTVSSDLCPPVCTWPKKCYSACMLHGRPWVARGCSQVNRCSNAHHTERYRRIITPTLEHEMALECGLIRPPRLCLESIANHHPAISETLRKCFWLLH